MWTTGAGDPRRRPPDPTSRPPQDLPRVVPLRRSPALLQCLTLGALTALSASVAGRLTASPTPDPPGRVVRRVRGGGIGHNDPVTDGRHAGSRKGTRPPPTLQPKVLLL